MGAHSLPSMWMDSRGVTHTVALPDPSVAMSPETITALEALSPEVRQLILDVLEDWYWNEYVSGAERTRITASRLASVGAALPSEYITARITCAEDALAVVRSTEAAWRIDVLEALQDYLEARDE